MLDERLGAFGGLAGLCLRDLKSGQEIQIRADQQSPTASTIKMHMLADLLELVEAGKLNWSERVKIDSTVSVPGSGVLAYLDDPVELTVRDVASHGWGFDRHWLFSRDEERERIRRAVASITASCGRRPVGSYFPFGPSVSTRELLVEEGGFLYDSDAYNDDLPYIVEVQGREHLVVPYSAVYNDGRFLNAPGFSSPHDFFQLCKNGLDQLRREAREGYPKMMSIGIHPKTIGQAGRVVALRQVLEYVTELGDVWVARREDIARWWLEHRHTWGC
jgi:peptidoglycan/xylan/chitin deacetylase (PgdA/CDA1 family)